MAPRENRTAKIARYPAAMGHTSDMQATLVIPSHAINVWISVDTLVMQPYYATSGSLPSYPQFVRAG